MVDAVSTSVNVNINPLPSEGRAPFMEIDSHLAFAAFVRHYPAASEKLTASIGSVSNTGVRVSEEIYEWVSFSGSTEAYTKYPIYSSLVWSIAGAVEDADGVIANHGIRYDSQRGLFVSKVPCYADLELSYKSRYFLLRYNPESTGYTAKYGVIRSRLNHQIAQFKVPAGQIGSTKRAELCRVVSYYIVGEKSGKKGAYESPNDFPDNLYYAGGQKIEEENSLQVERAHEIVSVDKLGSIYNENFFIEILEPFKGSAGYKPKFFLKRNTQQDGFEDAFSSVNWNDITDSLSSKYPGLSQE